MKSPRVVLIDYGIGNLRSAEKALAHLGADVELVTDVERAEAADAVVLPGVGAFGACAAALRASGLDEACFTAARRNIPFLGICVGFQLLFEGSDEDPGIAGPGLLPGRVRRLTGDVKLPQIRTRHAMTATGTRFAEDRNHRSRPEAATLRSDFVKKIENCAKLTSGRLRAALRCSDIFGPASGHHRSRWSMRRQATNRGSRLKPFSHVGRSRSSNGKLVM